MTTVSIKFSNSNEDPIYLQVDPWAGFYMLKKNEWIQIIAESEKSSPSFDVDVSKSLILLLILDSDDYFLVLDGQRMHCSQCMSNLPD